LRGADLRGVRLSNAVLNRADMRGCLMGPLPLGRDRSLPSSLWGRSALARLRGLNWTKPDWTERNSPVPAWTPAA
jgi:Pentapeptide repeats (8 copies).